MAGNRKPPTGPSRGGRLGGPSFQRYGTRSTNDPGAAAVGTPSGDPRPYGPAGIEASETSNHQHAEPGKARPVSSDARPTPSGGRVAAPAMARQRSREGSSGLSDAEKPQGVVKPRHHMRKGSGWTAKIVQMLDEIKAERENLGVVGPQDPRTAASPTEPLFEQLTIRGREGSADPRLNRHVSGARKEGATAPTAPGSFPLALSAAMTPSAVQGVHHVQQLAADTVMPSTETTDGTPLTEFSPYEKALIDTLVAAPHLNITSRVELLNALPDQSRRLMVVGEVCWIRGHREGSQQRQL